MLCKMFVVHAATKKIETKMMVLVGISAHSGICYVCLCSVTMTKIGLGLVTNCREKKIAAAATTASHFHISYIFAMCTVLKWS